MISQQKIPALNGVRGMAILLVLFAHLTVILPATAQARALMTVSSIGWIGVELFFVLSGFLITGILADTVDKPGYFRSFYARRALRILPLYYAIAIISFVILPLIPNPKTARFSTVGSDEIWYWLMLPNVAIAHAEKFRHGIMDVTWSVAIEEHFYLAWPLMIMALRGKNRAIFCAAIFVASFSLRTWLASHGTNVNVLYVSTPTHLDGLAAGSLIALLIRSPVSERRQRLLANFLIVAGGAGFWLGTVIGGTPDYAYNPWSITTGLSCLACAFAGLILKVYLGREASGGLNRILSSRILGTFGKYSYALYLFNLPLRAVLRDMVIRPESFSGFPGGDLMGQAFFYVAAGVLSLLMAWLSFHLFEIRFLRLKRRFPAGKPAMTPSPILPGSNIR